jgi:hypothetical protein
MQLIEFMRYDLSLRTSLHHTKKMNPDIPSCAYPLRRRFETMALGHVPAQCIFCLDAGMIIIYPGISISAVSIDGKSTLVLA